MADIRQGKSRDPKYAGLILQHNEPPPDLGEDQEDGDGQTKMIF